MAKGPSKGLYPFSSPQTAVTQHARKVQGHNGRSHDIAAIARPKGPSNAVKHAEHGENVPKATKMPAVKHVSKHVRTP